MYEFVQTETGWRVYWGVDPHAEGKAEKVETVVAGPISVPARESNAGKSVEPILTTRA
jgi:hypothetical protein